MDTDEEWRLTRGRKRYETVAMAGKRLGYDDRTMTRIIQRAGLEPDDHFNARTPVYLVTSVDKMMADRPGRGARGVARKSRRSTPGE